MMRTFLIEFAACAILFAVILAGMCVAANPDRVMEMLAEVFP